MGNRLKSSARRWLARCAAAAVLSVLTLDGVAGAAPVDELLARAVAEQSAGHLDAAAATLSQARQLAGEAGVDAASVQIALANQHILTRSWKQAEAALTAAAAALPADMQADARSTVMLESARGNFHLARNHSDADDIAQALAPLTNAARAAKETADPLLVAQTACNLARAARLAGRDDADALAAEAVSAARALPDSPERPSILITAAVLAGDRRVAHELLSAAYEAAKGTKNPRVESQALGHLSETYLAAGQLDEALACARRAAFRSQQMPDLLYRWQWQTGLVLQAKGDRDGAIVAYRLAADTLRPVRPTIAIGWGNRPSPAEAGVSPFRASVGDLYTQLASLLIQRSADSAGRGDRNAEIADLKSARDALEELKAAELEDYFQSDCATLTRSQITSVERLLDGNTAVVYVVPLAETTELLVSYADGAERPISRFTSPVGRAALLDSDDSHVRAFRRHLEDRTGNEYQESGKQVYDALIAPIHPFLKERGIDTLVFVPDDQLRTVPMAALWDGSRFLIEEFAVAVVPGLSLMEAQQGWRRPSVLAGGLTQRTELRESPGAGADAQTFPALRYVNGEIDGLKDRFNARTITDDQLTRGRLQSMIDAGRYNVVHLATHGEFRDESAETFLLLTGEDAEAQKLTLDELNALITPNQYRGAPVELLTLSACRSAAGDDRAALGLAGVALKAGARSSLATLWYVNDRVSADLVGEFYANLSDSSSGSAGMAKALQQAQLKVLKNETDRRYRHPCYWSPYVLIGLWK